MNLPLDLLRPDLLWVPALGLLLAALGVWSLVGRWRAMARLIHPSQLARFAPAYSPLSAGLRVVLAAGATVFLGLALLGPVVGYTYREVVGRGIDIVVCIDTSRSMLAGDVGDRRLNRAKREVVGLLNVLGGDRVALLAFSGDTREVAPLTHDRAALEQLLAHVSTDDNRLGGTNLASALRSALALFDGRTGSHEAIVLVTDGEDLSGEGLTVAREAAERNIRVFVVGVGSEGGGKIPIPDGAGGETFLKDREGNEVISRMDAASLTKLAHITGGEFLSVDQHPTPLEELYDKRIASIDGRELVGGKERIPHDRYQWALALALACMLGEVGLRERRLGGGRR